MPQVYPADQVLTFMFKNELKINKTKYVSTASAIRTTDKVQKSSESESS
jgi:hypothetical protein